MHVINRRHLSPDAEFDPGVIYVGRGTPWGNPYYASPLPPNPLTRAQAVEHYREYAQAKLEEDPHWIDPLRGATALACWCKPLPCHADVLVELLSPNP